MEILCPHVNDDHINWSIQGKSIYKDQCTKCFVEAKSEQGIAVCLKCFNGGCHQQHSPEHAKQHNHQIVLNIRLYEMEQQQQPQIQDINKLVIHDIPQLEMECKISCLQCQITLNSDKLDGLKQSIRNADSAFKRAAVGSWEHVAQPCEHTLTLIQEPLLNNNLQKCKDCNLSSNLWLCLTCGHVGCGRKAYDGSGGNNHAIDHSKQLGHGLVVKLGTITPEGDADVYCYACDDEVIDNFLKDHLAIFGIAVENQKKTEKNMAELNLDANLALQLSKLFEEGKILNPVFGPGLTGIDNIGNSCYMNSVIQVIFAMPEFQHLYSIDHQLKCTRIPYNCQLCQICKVNYGLNSGVFSIKKQAKSPLDIEGAEKDYYQDGIRLYDFKQLVATGNKEFLSNRQQDALEYWGIFLNYLQKQEKLLKLEPLSELFTFEQSSILKCLGCNGYKQNIQKNQEFKIPCQKPTQQQINEYHASEELKYQQRLLNLQPGEEPKPFVVDDLPEYDTSFQQSVDILKQGELVEMYCDRCQSNKQFHKREYFVNYPKYLFVPVNRFVLENWVPKKLNANMQIDQEYDFKDFHAPVISPQDIIQQQQQQQQQYDFVALEQLLNMGFTQNRCIRALIKAKNDVEQASMIVMEGLDDPSQDDPIEQPQQQQQHQQQHVNQEIVDQLAMMGFTEAQSKFALNKTDNNLERAVEYLFNHDIEQEMNQQQDQPKIGYQNDQSKYELYAAIVHLGKSVHCGHYVSYIRKNGKWFLFNDSKVAQSDDPALHRGYIYIFKRK